jgi:ribA/ribD-fused uncharacterized protein
MTSEHAYQYTKFSDVEIKKKILESRSGYDAKMISIEYKDLALPNWDEIKLEVMEKILRQKLAQHPHIKKKLVESADREIIEASKDDDFWGWGANKTGQNNHGKLWMKLRTEISN